MLSLLRHVTPVARIVFVLLGACVPAWPAPLPGQTTGSRAAGAVPLAEAGTAVKQDQQDQMVVFAAPVPLPPILTPAPVLDNPVAVQRGEGPVPVVFAIFGGIAGMFVGKWWMQSGCDESEENCDERGFYGLLAGGLVGTVVGWLIGGGEIPEPPPPGRWR
jgi:hypothetical protein